MQLVVIIVAFCIYFGEVNSLQWGQIRFGSRRTKLYAKFNEKLTSTPRLSKAIMSEIIDQLVDRLEGSELETADSNSDYSEVDSKLTDRHGCDQNTLLNGVLRIYCTHSEPNFAMPWQRLRQSSSTSSGFIIDGHRILTNAHAVEYGSLVQVKKRQSEKKYLASVVAGEALLLCSMCND